MSSEYPFFSTYELPNSWLDTIVRVRVEEILESCREWPDSGCLLADIGEFLTRATAGLSQLADGVVHGEHVDIYSQQKIDEMEQNDDFSELDPLIYLDEKHSSLKSIAVQLQSVSKQIGQTWKDSPAPPHSVESSLGFVAPFEPGSFKMAPTAEASSSKWASHYTEPDDAAGPASEAKSPHSDGHNQDTVDEPLASLSSRGKGNHVCPFDTCKKGGVRPDGQKNVFERNSEFKTHLQKHLRQHRCDVPNCRNKKGFARIDQLLRHQKTVHNRERT